MSRRSWFARLFLKDEELYFFGVQLVIRAFGEDTLRRRLAAVVADPDGDLQDVAAKQRYLKRIVALLLEQEPYWTHTYWEYVTGEEGQTMFEEWSAELSASSATEDEEVGDDVDQMRRLSNRKDYVAATILLLQSVPYPPGEAVTDERRYWQRETLRSLVNGILYVNPETILGDAVFVMPGSPEDGLSEEDLLTGGWSHLRVIM
ncbi:DUF1517 domain-containing protein [Chloracidobacterium thermophilum]|uniref:DUF1517 domain-containing protein n=1 Tax=Chloracidobacterium thermophilum TaxID=458033 RepID=UPI000738984D|nr:DUF1517 domain-containing protein [Chloracidobacterium thermophilum]